MTCYNLSPQSSVPQMTVAEQKVQWQAAASDMKAAQEMPATNRVRKEGANCGRGAKRGAKLTANQTS